jgi:hypothetical protein
MQYVKLFFENESYDYFDGNSITMDILGCFLATDVGCYWPLFKEWAIADKTASDTKFNYELGANLTYLTEEDNCIYLKDHYALPENANMRLKMTREQFVQLLDDWQEKVCKHKPREVTIIYDGTQFTIETRG